MKIFLFLMLFCITALYGAPMGEKDAISRSWTVKNQYWSCSFIEGAMFPGNFVFSDGSSAGRILFRDSAVYQQKKFDLFEERHADCRIISNTESDFIIELSGTYWRNITPLISRINGVEVICRYEFQKNSPSVKMIFKYNISNPADIKFDSFFNIGWYYENPFGKIIADGSSFEMKKGMNLNRKKSIIFTNNNFKVELDSENVFAEIPARKSVIVCSFGSKNLSVQSNSLCKSAILTLSKY